MNTKILYNPDIAHKPGEKILIEEQVLGSKFQRLIDPMPVIGLKVDPKLNLFENLNVHVANDGLPDIEILKFKSLMSSRDHDGVTVLQFGDYTTETVKKPSYEDGKIVIDKSIVLYLPSTPDLPVVNIFGRRFVQGVIQPSVLVVKTVLPISMGDNVLVKFKTNDGHCIRCIEFTRLVHSEMIDDCMLLQFNSHKDTYIDAE